MEWNSNLKALGPIHVPMGHERIVLHRDITPILETQMEKLMDNEMEAADMQGLIRIIRDEYPYPFVYERNYSSFGSILGH